MSTEQLSARDSVQAKAFWQWLNSHASERQALADIPPDVVSRLWADAWSRGAWDAIHRTSVLSGFLQRLEELIDVFRTAEIEREAEASSTYWHSQEPQSECEFDPDHVYHAHEEVQA